MIQKNFWKNWNYFFILVQTGSVEVNPPVTSQSGNQMHHSILNRIKIQFENVISSKQPASVSSNDKSAAVVAVVPVSTAKSENAEEEAVLATSEPDENQRTMTKKDGLAFLEQCMKQNDEQVSDNLKSPNEIANKLNDLYFKQQQEENKGNN